MKPWLRIDLSSFGLLLASLQSEPLALGPDSDFSEVFHQKRRSTAALHNVAAIVCLFVACVLECGGAPPLCDAADKTRHVCTGPDGYETVCMR